MNILKPNSGKEVHYIISSHVYVKVWDYGKKYLLINLEIPYAKTSYEGLGKSSWAWLDLTEGSCTDLSELGHSTFENAINKAVNNPYTTVYEFDSYEEMAIHWEDIRYVDTITTTFKAKKND